MKELFMSSSFSGVFLTLCVYEAGRMIRKKCRVADLNPLPIAMILCIIILKISGIPYETYRASAQPVSWLLTPATTVLAVPLYRQMDVLRRNGRAVFGGVLMGVLGSLLSVLVLSLAFGLSRAQYVTLLPKSVTTPIGMAVAAALLFVWIFERIVIVMAGG